MLRSGQHYTPRKNSSAAAQDAGWIPRLTGTQGRVEADGAQPIVSFGGESGSELAASCSSLSQLTAAYESVISTLHVTHIDFDIEGAEIAYTADNALRFQAINALEAANPGLV